MFGLLPVPRIHGLGVIMGLEVAHGTTQFGPGGREMQDRTKLPRSSVRHRGLACLPLVILTFLVSMTYFEKVERRFADEVPTPVSDLTLDKLILKEAALGNF
jgi:hypothetical protein